MSLRDIEFNVWKYFLAKALNYTILCSAFSSRPVQAHLL